jgi:hypothetical protein
LDSATGHDRRDIGFTDATVHDAFACLANCAQITGIGFDRPVLDQADSGSTRFAAAQAVEGAGWTWGFAVLQSFDQKLTNDLSIE